ncbi:hypothetical protein [Pseudomonas alabamensis]|uniref:hypothetical protein n=1 Tax=Pseudomonas alabamensis TaxID=3064349 RepID=UPI003F650901
MIATSPACVGIVTCTVPAALGTLGTLSLQDAWESAKGITADFQSSEPQRVADSFQLGTFPGDESATTELLKDAAIAGAGATALGAAERTYRRVAGWVTSGAKGLEIAPGKFDYMFGRVVSSSHNAARSNQLALEMKRLGVPDTVTGRQMLTDHLVLSAKTDGNVMSTFSNQYGKFEVRESLFIGPSGKAANFQSTFQVLDDGTRKLSAVIPLH